MTVSVTTTARSFSVPPFRGRRFHLDPRLILSAFLVSLLSLLLFRDVQDRRRRRWSPVSLAVVAAGLILVSIGCGGGGGSSPPPPQIGTPAGTYSVTVTATSGSTVHTTSLTLAVN